MLRSPEPPNTKVVFRAWENRSGFPNMPIENNNNNNWHLGVEGVRSRHLGQSLGQALARAPGDIEKPWLLWSVVFRTHWISECWV